VALPYADEDIAQQRVINSKTQRMFASAVELANIRLNIALIKHGREAAAKLKLPGLLLKEAKLTAQYGLDKTAAHVERSRARMTELPHIPYAVASQLKIELDEAEAKGEPMTRDAFEDRMYELTNENPKRLPGNWQEEARSDKTEAKTIRVGRYGNTSLFNRVLVTEQAEAQAHYRKKVMMGVGTLAGLSAALMACSAQVDSGEIPTAVPATTEAPATGVPATEASPTVTAEPIVGISSPTTEPSPEAPTSTAEAGEVGVWAPPTVEQALVAGTGGAAPADVGTILAYYESRANGKIPGAVTFESSWNQGIQNDLRVVATARNAAGDILWSTGPIGYNEYGIYWTFDANGELQVAPDQTFAPIPDSKDALVGFTGSQGETGNGEKPVPMRKIITLPDGRQVFSEYFNFLSGTWQEIPGVADLQPQDGDTRTVDGKEQTWNKELGVWMESHGEAFMLDDKGAGLSKMITLEVAMQEGITGPSIAHTSVEGNQNAASFSKILFGDLRDRYFEENNIAGTSEDKIQFFKDLQAGKISISYTDSNGEPQKLKINKDTVVEVNIVEWDAVQTDFEWNNMRFFTTGDGKTHLYITAASAVPFENMTDEEFAEFVLFAFARVVLAPDQSLEFFKNNQLNRPALPELISWATNGATPHLVIERE
jgi:hypothetical protein